jgi:hypothetical protein
MRHGRLPWPKPDDLSAAATAVYEAITGGPRASAKRLFRSVDEEGRLEGPFNAMLVSPEVGYAQQELGAAIRYRTALTDRVREVAILTLAAFRESEFEGYAHEAVGAACGLTHAELSQLRTGSASMSLRPDERLAHTLVTRLLKDRTLDDATYAEAVEVFGETGVIELVMLVGYYDTLDLMMAVAQTPLPSGVEPIYSGPDA